MRYALRSLASIQTSGVKAAAKPQNQVFITHAKWVTGKEQLTRYFSRYGKVKEVSMFFDPITGLHRGFASVTFANSEGAHAAIQNRPHVIDGDIVNVEVFMPFKTSKAAAKSTM
ncbi:nucleoprotein [Aphelenchoides fujianensis]|nr:nucleoprotein [Aphelenchoides fujianensis]